MARLWDMRVSSFINDERLFYSTLVWAHDVFSSIPSLSGWCFLQLICGGIPCPLRILPQAEAAVSPTDKSQKHGALPTVTTEKTSLRPIYDVG